jgi:hypothetical protein
MAKKYVIKKIILPKYVPPEGVKKTQPTLENTIKSVLSYCNAFPNLCEIKEVPDDYENNHELVFYFDPEKYRFFDVMSPAPVFYGIKYGDEQTVDRYYYSRLVRSMVTLVKAEDLLKLMGIEPQYIDSFVWSQLNKESDNSE